MPSRRAHSKSRLGCKNCKARRVKCDQTHPTCNNCTRHEKVCVYERVKPRGVGSASPAPDASNGIAADHGGSLLATASGPLFDSLDMRLLHHFCTSTASAMSFSPKAQQVWRLIVPEKAYDHHMLMHGLLTLAANHYVHVKQETTDPTALHMYRTRALHHQQLGLQLFRHQLQAPSEETSQGILLTFAAMIGMLTFSDASSQQQKLTYEDALGVLSVLRGKQALWRASSGLPETSDVAAAFFDPPPAEYRADLSSTAFALNELHDTTKDVVRRTSISLLKGVIENPFNSEYRLLGTWPAALSDEFNQLLRNRDGVAMQILGHYCTVMDSMRNLWWIGDIGSMLREAIRAEIEGVSPVQS